MLKGSSRFRSGIRMEEMKHDNATPAQISNMLPNDQHRILHIAYHRPHHLHNFTHHTCMHQHLTEAPHIKTQIAWHYMALSREGGPIPKKLWIWHRVQRPLNWKFPTKVEIYSKIWSRITHFIYCCESHFCIFYHQIYVPDCQGGMEILDIPRFWKHLFSEVIFKPLNEKSLNKKIIWLEGLVAKFCHLNRRVWWQNVWNLTHHFFRTAANTVQCPAQNITVYKLHWNVWSKG